MKKARIVKRNGRFVVEFNTLGLWLHPFFGATLVDNYGSSLFLTEQQAKQALEDYLKARQENNIVVYERTV